jgi:hypothetical protein
MVHISVPVEQLRDLPGARCRHLQQLFEIAEFRPGIVLIDAELESRWDEQSEAVMLCADFKDLPEILTVMYRLIGIALFVNTLLLKALKKGADDEAKALKTECVAIGAINVSIACAALPRTHAESFVSEIKRVLGTDTELVFYPESDEWN